MISSVLICGAMVVGALALDVPSDDPKEWEAYRSAAAAAGQDAAAHVRLALWCEAHGLTAERLEHLSRAVLAQPSNALARGLLGLMRHQGQWERPEVVGERSRDDPARQALVREYLDRRVRTPSTSQAQMELAIWCEGNHLKGQALAHFNEVLRIDPSREAAWRHLGYRKHGPRWVKPEQLAAEKQEAIRQKQADKRWRTRLAKIRDDLQSKAAARRARAEESLAKVTDPRAVPAIWAVFVAGGVRHQMAAIRMFGRIDGPSASNALAALAVLHPSPEVRGRATEALMRRDPRDVVGRLIGMVHKPFKYEVRPVQGPGSPGELFVEGERFNVQRIYENQTTGFLLATGAGRLYTPDVPFDPFSIRNLVATLPAWMTGPAENAGSGFTASYPAPVAPEEAARAAKAMAANPEQAQAILNQLVSDPNNRVLPPGWWFPDTNPADSIPVHLRKVPGPIGHLTPDESQGMQAFARQVQAQQNDPHSPMGRSVQLGRIENNPAHRQSGQALGIMAPAQQMAARRDYELGVELARVQQSNQNLRQRLAMDVQFIEWTNEGIKQTNARVLPVLKAITGLDLGLDRKMWKTWWMDQLDLSWDSGEPQAKPTYRESVTDSTGMYNPAAVSPVPERAPTSTDPATGRVPTVPVRACFAAGTSVSTIDGPRPIESLQVGDRVLSQDLATGALNYQPVLGAHRHKPAPTLRISAAGESIVATDLQRFWKAGKGWMMARELKVGDRLRVIGGVVEVTSIGNVRTQPVYNVDVAEHGDLFVGARCLLVHDFGFVPSVPEPFDRRPEQTPPAASTRR
jgi:hypothetical protein